ncbi:unnamed protein product, partial [Effrenium voratum]
MAMWVSNTEEKYWEKSTVDEAARRRLNGESAWCMDHVKKIKAAGGISLNPEHGSDTAADQPWAIDESCMAKLADTYCLVTTALWMLPKAIIFVLPMLLLNIPSMVVIRCYAGSFKPGTDEVKRSCGYWLSFLLAAFCYIPAGILAIVMLWLDYVFYWIFGLVFCLFTFRWCAVWKSMRALDPYRNGPWIILHIPDLYTALIGQTNRQGVFEVTYTLATCLYIMPWLKYYMNCNPWLHNLDHRMVNQISTELAEINPLEHRASIARDIISRTKHKPQRASKLDLWSFVPHYPYPPPGRRYAMGFQQGGTWPKSFLLMVHTTHANRADGGSTEQMVLSNTCSYPVYRVMLWYNNPYHFYSGWVEAQLTTGGVAQPEKA